MLVNPPILGTLFVIFGYIFAEIAAFIFIGSRIGILASLSLVLLSAFVGFWLLRDFGRGFANSIMRGMNQGEAENSPLLSRRLLTCLAAILLISPGFISSFIGLILLIPIVQDRLAGFLRRKSLYRASFTYREEETEKNPREQKAGQSDIIDLEPENYHARDPESSPWRKP